MTKEERKVYMKAYNKANLDKMNAFRKAYYISRKDVVLYTATLFVGYGVTENYIKKK